jgi:hypothetical protein
MKSWREYNFGQHSRVVLLVNQPVVVVVAVAVTSSKYLARVREWLNIICQLRSSTEYRPVLLGHHHQCSTNLAITSQPGQPALRLQHCSSIPLSHYTIQMRRLRTGTGTTGAGRWGVVVVIMPVWAPRGCVLACHHGWCTTLVHPS